MTPRDRRALVIGAVVAATAWLGLRAVPWAVREARDRRERFAAREQLLARARAEVREAAALADSVPALQGRIVALAPSLLSGSGESEAVADLGGRANTLATEARVRLVKTSAVPDTARAGRLRRATAQVTVEGDTRGVLAWLTKLEQGPAVLTVADVQLAAADPASPPAGPEVISAEVLVRGWYVSTAAEAGR